MNAVGPILVVDDDKALTLGLALRLRSVGFEVRVCNDAGDAGAVAVREKPAAIILDIDMPRCTGLELHHCFQFAARLRDTPVIYLSGYRTEAHLQMAAEQGASAFLTKPYIAEELVAALRSAIQQRMRQT